MLYVVIDVVAVAFAGAADADNEGDRPVFASLEPCSVSWFVQHKHELRACMHLRHLVPALTLLCMLLQVNTRPTSTANACQSSSCASSEADSLSRSNSAQSLEHIRRLSGGCSSSSDIDMSDYPILPSTPKPIDRSHSYHSIGSDSNKSIAIAAVHPISIITAEPTYSNEAAIPQKGVVIGAGAVPGAEKSAGGFNKWMVGLVKGSNASKRKEARIGQLLKAAAAAGGAVGGGQYCPADAGSHAFCSKAVLRGSPWKCGVYKH